MTSPNRPALPVCICGTRELEIASPAHSSSGRTEYRLVCPKCRTQIPVDKTTFALFQYITRRTPSRRFLKLFDLG